MLDTRQFTIDLNCISRTDECTEVMNIPVNKSIIHLEENDFKVVELYNE